MNIEKYILSKKTVLDSASQCQWKARLDTKMGFFNGIKEKPHELYQYFERRVRTEELKAWYSSPDPGDLFQGTSISSLVIPATFKRPLEIKGVEQLVEEIADCYIRYHDKYAKAVSDAIVESVEGWIKEGLFYGVVLPSKIISQAFDLAVDTRSLVVDIEGDAIDPHEITSYPAEIREKYFNSVRPGIECLSDMNISRQEFEASLILADVSKPKIQKYKGKALLGPIKCN
ncbi:MAG TPA: hypothetical protein PKG81_02875, partial [Candidatus Omnitrophota bacterium]|nr:hypothetical protein [Candidatus Omnitrophota bacterium]